MTYVTEGQEEKGIRSYGPGKFSTMVDAYVYSVSLDGCDETHGSCSENGVWIGRMSPGRGILRDMCSDTEPLNEDEARLLTACAGVILEENDQGFVSVTYYQTDDELQYDWNDYVKFIDS